MSDYRVSVSVSMPEWFRRAAEDAADELDMDRSEFFREGAKELARQRGLDTELDKESGSTAGEGPEANAR